MLPFQYLILMPAIVATDAKSFCKGGKKPKVSVASSTQLKVSWEDAFKDCDDANIVATAVHVGNLKLAQTPVTAKKAKVTANPCIRHSIRVELWLKRSSGSPDTVWSHASYYNADFKIENVYSGLLNGKFKEDICVISNNNSLLIDQIPEIPDEIKNCVYSYHIKRNGPHGFIVPVIKLDSGKGRSEIKVDCKQMNEQPSLTTNKPSLEPDSEEKTTDNHKLIIVIIACGAILAFLIASVIIAWACFKRWRDKKMVKVDVNVNYDTAGVDYEYGPADQDYDTMGDEVSTRRREVKMEVVDIMIIIIIIIMTIIIIIIIIIIKGGGPEQRLWEERGRLGGSSCC